MRFTFRGRVAAIVSYRLGGPDGVSVEAAKWAWALRRLGFDVRTVAGSGTADVIVPGLAAGAGAGVCGAQLRAEVEAALAGADLVVVENLCSLPLNKVAGEVVAEVLAGRPAVLHHHDLAWQRPQFPASAVPPNDPAWLHVTINDLSRRELAERGIPATTIRNSFHPRPPAGRREYTRALLGVAVGERLVVHPSRALERKGVPEAVALAEALDATYWLLGPAEDGYGPQLERVLAGAGVPVHHGRLEELGLTVADAYAACDAVVFPSHWEGFGNPVIEAALYRRPLAVAGYPVLQELAAFGFRWFPAGDPSPLDKWLRRPAPYLLDHNQAVARRRFSLYDLPRRIASLLEAARRPR
ncbi:MAG TPA: glycosyltransferase family 4 protein [Acidimicrobiales bacterium]|nr:glycosyltransferase family 4 protein [Acidimicrobiales bacterium]